MAANLRVIVIHFVDGISWLGAQRSLALNAQQPGKAAAESIKRIQGGYLIVFTKKLYFVPDSQVVCAEVEDLDAQEAGPPDDAAVNAFTLAAAVHAEKPASRLSEHEIAAQAALEDRKRVAHERALAKAAEEAAERTKAKPAAPEALERARKEIAK